MSARLSKTRFIAGRQCELRLWNDIHHRERATPWGETQQAVFDRGTRVGELACQRYPGGTLVGFKPWEREPAIAETRRLMADPSVPAIYEAAFEHRGLYARVDVLARNGDGWDLIEVKASTRPEKEVFLQDVAVQYWTLVGAGLDIVRAGVLVLDREYVYEGGDYDLQRLFRFGDATEYCIESQPAIEADVDRFQAMLAADAPPDITVGDHCFSPYECPYYAHCSAGLPRFDHPVSDLYRLRAAQRDELAALGIEEIVDIPDDFELNGMQARMRRAVIEGTPWVSPQLATELASLTYPAYFLDFEAFMPALPPYPGTRPFHTLPFLYSVHRLAQDGDLKHREYLHEQSTDPRRSIAERLILDLGDTGSIVVYSGYERRMINDLIEACPDLAEALEAIRDRLWDLLPIVRNHYYHPDFHGSFSIKAVLPVLDPETGWSELDIADGMAAAMAYEVAVANEDVEQKNLLFGQLKDYCKQDTEAMVRLHAALLKLDRITTGEER
jgi:predicted RecB family nuclease